MGICILAGSTSRGGSSEMLHHFLIHGQRVSERKEGQEGKNLANSIIWGMRCIPKYIRDTPTKLGGLFRGPLKWGQSQ